MGDELVRVEAASGVVSVFCHHRNHHLIKGEDFGSYYSRWVVIDGIILEPIIDDVAEFGVFPFKKEL